MEIQKKYIQKRHKIDNNTLNLLLINPLTFLMFCQYYKSEVNMTDKETKKWSLLLYHDEYDEQGETTWQARLICGEEKENPVYESHNTHKQAMGAIKDVIKWAKDTKYLPFQIIYTGRFKKGCFPPTTDEVKQ